MKNYTLLFLLLVGSIFSCEKPSVDGSTSVVIVANTCGGTVIQFVSLEFGEEWTNNFGDANSYDNVALTGDLESNGHFGLDRYREGDILVITFEEVDTLEGNFCAIGGLPDTNVQIAEIISKR